MSDTTKNLYQRMAAVMEDVQRLQKDKQVGEAGGYGYKAVSEEKVSTTVRAAFIEHGLVIFPVNQVSTITDYTRQNKIVSMAAVDTTYKIVNIDNPKEFELIVSSGSGVDSQDKGIGKAMTYALKYALLRTFMIPTGNDPDSIHNSDLERQQEAEAARAEHSELQRQEAAKAAVIELRKCKTVQALTELKESLPGGVKNDTQFIAAGKLQYETIIKDAQQVA